MARLSPSLKLLTQVVAVSFTLFGLGLLSTRPLLAQSPAEMGQAALSLPPNAYQLPQHQLSRQLDDTTLLTPNARETSSFMLGRVAVGVIFPQSDGSQDPITERWTVAQQNQILAKINTALTWWETLDPAVPLEFVLAPTQTPLTTTVEPIAHPHTEQYLWINDTLAQLGFTEGTHFDRVLAYNNYLRQSYHTDWAFTIFVLNSTADADNRLPEGYFAYAYLGGPFTVLTSGVGNYGLSNFDAVLAHEIGHIFHALDQYASAGHTCTLEAGYLGVPNQNSQQNCASDLPSLMRGQVRPYQSRQLDFYARGQIGWQDSNANNILDPLDISPHLSQIDSRLASVENKLIVSGQITASPWPSTLARSQSINRWQKLCYQVNGQGRWYAITPSDGFFDSLHEAFTFTTVALPSGTHTFTLRAKDQFGQSWEWLLGPVSVVDPFGTALNTTLLGEPDTLPLRSNYVLPQGETLILEGQAESQISPLAGITAYLTTPDDDGFLLMLTTEALDGTFDEAVERFYVVLNSLDLPPREYSLTVQAYDTLGHIETTPASIEIDVVLPEPQRVFLPLLLSP